MLLGRKIQELLPELTDDALMRIDAVIDRYRDRSGSLIPVLEQCQEIFGYLPVELQEHIGRGLNIAGSTIFGVVSFYSFFTMVPRGRHSIKVCMGTACYVRGVAEVLSRIKTAYNLEVGQTTTDRRFSLESVRCLGACGLAPVIVIDNDTHGFVTPESILNILARYE